MILVLMMIMVNMMISVGHDADQIRKISAVIVVDRSFNMVVAGYDPPDTERS
jgi:hypothetical protein